MNCPEPIPIAKWQSKKLTQITAKTAPNNTVKSKQLTNRRPKMTTAKAKLNCGVLMSIAAIYNIWVLVTAAVRDDGNCDIEPMLERLYSVSYSVFRVTNQKLECELPRK